MTTIVKILSLVLACVLGLAIRQAARDMWRG